MHQQPQYPLYQREAVLQRRREPPPYPGPSRAFQNAGYRQSYASSETGSTDLSLSSCENLCTAMRQDPQGEENTSLLSSPVDAQGYNNLMQAATAVEVKSANSSTFYVTGNMQSQHDEVNMTSYTAFPHMHYGGPGEPPQGMVPQQLPPSTPSTPDHMQPPFIQHQGYSNQYYNSNQNQNSKAFVSQSQQVSSVAQYPVMQPQQASFSDCVQQADSQHNTPPNATRRYNSVKNSTSPQGGANVSQIAQPHTTHLPPSKKEQPIDYNSKQDPFKKWRHFYVNQKTQLNQYKLLNLVPEGQGDSQNKNVQNISPNKLTKSMSGSQLTKQQVDSVSNVRATNRSATPDMFSDRPSISRQLPLRPSSANSKQRNQDRPISFAQLKQQKLAKVPIHQSHESTKNVLPDIAKEDTRSTISTMSTSSSEVDNNANKVFKQHSSGKVPFGFQAALNKFVASGEKSLNEQRQLLRSPPQSRSATRLPRPRTAPPHRSGEKLQQVLHEKQSPTNNLKMSNQLKDSRTKEISRSCELLNELCQTSSQQQPDSTQVHSLFLDENCAQFKSLSSHRKPQSGSGDSQDSRSKLGNGEVDHAAIATRATQMVERLSDENHSLRQDLERFQAKVAKLQKFEAELQKVSDEHQNLVKHSQKQESLEKVMRFKQGCEIKKLKDTNKELKDQLEKCLQKENSNITTSTDSDLRRELKEKDRMLTKLISQNRELNKATDRIDIELAGEKVRNEERLNHVNVLEKALKTCQSQVFKLEEEVGRLRIRETKIEQLQSALSQLQVATEKREAIELKLRHRLEDEIRLLKHKSGKGGSKASDTDEGISSDSECPTRMHSIVRQMQEKDTNILRLQSCVAHWEQKFYEEGALRILAVDAASAPKDARIAALEITSHDTGRLIEQSRTDRLRHLEEVYKAKKSTTELEAKVRTLELQLAERDAMVRVLNRHSTTSISRTSSSNSLFSSPLQSPLPSFNSTMTTTPTPGPAVCVSSPHTPLLQHRDLSKFISHTKSNSDGAVLDFSSLTTSPNNTSTMTTDATSKHEKLEPTIKELHKKLAAQAAIFQNWQKEEPDDIKKDVYQV